VVLGRHRDRASVPLLLARLSDPETWEKPAVLVALGRIGAPEAVPALVAAAAHSAPWVRVCAIHALGEMAVPDARAVALAHADDPAWSVRGAAATALGAAGGPDDLGPLLAFLRDPHPWPRRSAIYAIGRLGLTEAAPGIRDELGDPVADVRLAAIWAIGRLGDDGAREELVRLLYGLRPGDGTARDVENAVGGGGLASDAESRLFDAVVQSLGRLARGGGDAVVHRALLDVRERLSDEELDRVARLPLPELASERGPPTLRALFDAAIPTPAEDEEAP